MGPVNESTKPLTGVVIVLCALVTGSEGLDLQSAGVAAPQLALTWHLGPSILGWFFSMSTFGMISGAAVGGRRSDRLGRKMLLLSSVEISGLASVASALAPSLYPLEIARFVTGLGLGSALPNALALVAEAGLPGHR